ncbi:hypothetical protein XENORESO_000278, partial [Xenotaenia resolanae]
TMKAVRCPTEDLSLTNCAVINEKEPNLEQHVAVYSNKQEFVFTLKTHPEVSVGSIAFSLPQQQDAGITVTFPRRPYFTTMKFPICTGLTWWKLFIKIL